MDALANIPGYIQATAAVIATLLTIWAIRWHRRDSEQAQFASKGSLQEMGRRVDEHERRLADVEAAVRLMPSHQDLSGIKDAVNAVNSNLGVLTGQMSSVERQVSMVQDYLMKNKGGGPH